MRCTLSAFYLKRTFFRGTRACTHKPPQLGHRSLMSACPRIAEQKQTWREVRMKRREQVQRNCQCASTSRQKTHQAKADRAPRFRQCLIIARRSSTCRVELHWHLGPRRRSRPHGAHRGGLGQVNSAGRDFAEYNLERKRTSSTSSAGLPKRRAVDTYPRYGWARPGHACLWTDILNPL